MKKPKHLTFKNYQEASTSEKREALAAELFEYTDKLETAFRTLKGHIGELFKTPAFKELAEAQEPIEGQGAEAFEYDAFTGQTVPVNETARYCPDCNGIGADISDPRVEPTKCETCSGTGLIEGAPKASEAEPVKKEEPSLVLAVMDFDEIVNTLLVIDSDIVHDYGYTTNVKEEYVDFLIVINLEKAERSDVLPHVEQLAKDYENLTVEYV